MDESGENEINLTDSDAITVKFGAHQGTDAGYNIQAVVDSKNKLITTFDVNNLSQDQCQLYDMAIKAKEIYEVDKLEAVADEGYFDNKDIARCNDKDIITYVSKAVYDNQIGDTIFFTNKFKYDRDSDNVDNLISRVNDDKSKYSQRKSIVEHPFGTIKRSMNFTYLLLRNLPKVKGEISLAFFSYNLKRVINILGIKKILRSLCAILNKIHSLCTACRGLF